MNLLFLAYLNRSGSTFLADLLSRDPRFCVCPEAHRPLPEKLLNTSLDTTVELTSSPPVM